jgi:hypothetical protein
MPINKYNVTQTGPNIQLGGLSAGFSSVAYQFETEEVVKNDPTTPASSEIVTVVTSFQILFECMLVVYTVSQYKLLSSITNAVIGYLENKKLLK